MSDRTSLELEKDAETARAQVANTAESIRSKMSPGQLMEEFTNYFSGGDGSVALRNLGNQVRDNPLPLTMVGAGLAWLMLGSSSQRESTGDPYIQSQPTGDRYSNPTESDSGHLVSDFLSDGSRRVGDAVNSATGMAADLVRSASEGFSGASQSAASNSADLGEKAKQAASVLLDQDPLILALLGVAVGTAIGTILPRSNIEDQQFGAHRDQLMDSASDLLDEGMDTAKELAVKAYDAAKREADSDSLKDSGLSVAEKVGKVAKTVAGKVEPEIRKKLGAE